MRVYKLASHATNTGFVHRFHSADERFDATFHTNVLVSSNGACQYLPPGTVKLYLASIPHHFCNISRTLWGVKKRLQGCRLQISVTSNDTFYGILWDAGVSAECCVHRRFVTQFCRTLTDHTGNKSYDARLASSCSFYRAELLEINQWSWELMFQKWAIL